MFITDGVDLPEKIIDAHAKGRLVFFVGAGASMDDPSNLPSFKDSDDLRATLWQLLTDGHGYLRAYVALCKASRQLPDSNIGTSKWAERPARELMDELHWLDAYQLFENLFDEASDEEKLRISDEVNQCLERSGIAYEMREGIFELLDPEATAFGIRRSEHEAVEALTEEFAPVRAQYQNALGNLHKLDANYEGALADALNALEAVVKILTGNETSTLSKLVPRLFPDGEGYHAPLRAAIVKLYAYANELPGARHGRYADPVIAYRETVMVVRVVGALITFLVADYREAGRHTLGSAAGAGW